MPRARSICNQSRCTKIATDEGRCGTHKRKPWENTSARNLSRPADWNRRRRFVLRKDGTCYICRVRTATEVDHVIPVARGGSHDYKNLRGICPLCHRLKTAQERRAA